LFTDVTGLHADQAADGCDTCPAVRLPLLMLAPIATAYEGAMSGTEAARSTWRADRYSPCPRPDAGRYLAFLASIGYQLTVIEQAVADGVPYTGDTPPEPIPGDHDADVDDANGTSRADDANGESKAADEGRDDQNGADETSRADDVPRGSEDAALGGGDGLDGVPSAAA
jgi:ParB family chromosome partitioning protein